MTSCSKVEEEIGEEDGKQENSSGDTDEIVATLEAMPMPLNWGKIFSLPNETSQHMIIALKHLEFFADKVNWAIL